LRKEVERVELSRELVYEVRVILSTLPMEQ
jgi:hypothetical protein